MNWNWRLCCQVKTNILEQPVERRHLIQKIIHVVHLQLSRREWGKNPHRVCKIETLFSLQMVDARGLQTNIIGPLLQWFFTSVTLQSMFWSLWSVKAALSKDTKNFNYLQCLVINQSQTIIKSNMEQNPPQVWGDSLKINLTNITKTCVTTSFWMTA